MSKFQPRVYGNHCFKGLGRITYVLPYQIFQQDESNQLLWLDQDGINPPCHLGHIHDNCWILYSQFFVNEEAVKVVLLELCIFAG